MSDRAVNIENLSKAYRIGLKEIGNATFAGSILASLKSPFSNFKKLKSLSNISHEEVSDDIIWALKDVSMEVKRGEVVGIIGKNGAGKSTLLKVISNITEPTSGRIEIFGRVASLLEVGTGFNPELTGRENVYLNGTILGMTKKEVAKKFDEIVEFSGVQKFVDTPVKRYSSGMKVRLAFAVAAHLEPEILIVDEVLSVGDAEFQKKCLGKMESITSEGRTILFVSHNMSAIKNLCSRAVLLKEGEVVSTGNTEKVIDEYMNVYKNHIVDGNIPDNFPRNDFNKGYAYFKKIQLKNSNGKVSDYFSYHQSLTISVAMEVLKEITDGTFIVLIGSSNDDKISYSSTSDDLNTWVNLKPGYHEFEVKLAQNFLPGTYFITLVLMDGQGFPYDNVGNVVDFTVGNMKEDSDAYYRWGKVLANVNTKSEWKFPEKINLKRI
jgi:lipopolysaccharide transport system ATP-binding protein